MRERLRYFHQLLLANAKATDRCVNVNGQVQVVKQLALDYRWNGEPFRRVMRQCSERLGGAEGRNLLELAKKWTEGTVGEFGWLGDSGSLQIRVEAFNLLNRPNFAPPALTAFAGAADGEAPLSTFGRIRATVNSSRQIQLGLRIAF